MCLTVPFVFLPSYVDHVGLNTASLSAVASLVDTNDADQISAAMDKVPDPAGTFYRYSLPASLFHRNANGNGNGGA